MNAACSLFAAVLLVISPSCIAAPQEADRGAATLFVISQPYFARVELDGRRLEGRTPLVVRSVTPGEHQLVLSREGFSDDHTALSLAAGEVKAVEIQLESESIDICFPHSESLSINDQNVDIKEASVYVAPGSYTLSKDEESINIRPLFPQQRLLDALKIAAPALFVLSGIVALESLTDTPGSGRVVSMAVVTAQVTSIALVAATAIINNQKRKYLCSYPVPATSRLTSEINDRLLYETAEKQLGAGEIDTALANFQAITSSEMPSSYYPKALYRQSKIMNLLGDRDAAVQGYQQIVDDYPLPELYDRSLKNLADLMLSKGEYGRSMQYLDSMVFWDAFYSQEEIDSYRSDILDLRYQDGKGSLSDVLEAYGLMVQKYADSDSVGLYRYRYAYCLHLAGDQDGASAQIELIGLESIGDKLKEDVADLSRRIEAAGG